MLQAGVWRKHFCKKARKPFFSVWETQGSATLLRLLQKGFPVEGRMGIPPDFLVSSLKNTNSTNRCSIMWEENNIKVLI